MIKPKPKQRFTAGGRYIIVGYRRPVENELFIANSSQMNIGWAQTRRDKDVLTAYYNYAVPRWVVKHR